MPDYRLGLAELRFEVVVHDLERDTVLLVLQVVLRALLLLAIGRRRVDNVLGAFAAGPLRLLVVRASADFARQGQVLGSFAGIATRFTCVGEVGVA